jgi:hypothetical protein
VSYRNVGHIRCERFVLFSRSSSLVKLASLSPILGPSFFFLDPSGVYSRIIRRSHILGLDERLSLQYGVSSTNTRDSVYK